MSRCRSCFEEHSDYAPQGNTTVCSSKLKHDFVSQWKKIPFVSKKKQKQKQDGIYRSKPISPPLKVNF